MVFLSFKKTNNRNRAFLNEEFSLRTGLFPATFSIFNSADSGIELQQAPDATSVASYQALNDEAGEYLHVLQDGGGPSSVAPDQRVQLILNEEHHAAEPMTDDRGDF